MKSLLLVTAALLTFDASASVLSPDVVYGKDNRVEASLSKNPEYRRLAQSVATLIPNKYVINLPLSKTRIRGSKLTKFGVCKTERFASQISAGDCTGFLVAPDLLVTAGHCITSMDDCNSKKWVFDYTTSKEKQGSMNVKDSSVYSCVEIIERKLDRSNRNDYALLRLDRKVTDREPLKFRGAGKAAIGDELVIIGSPSGLPLKVADGAAVRSLEEVFFVANLDSFGGNSGSPVINAKTSEVEGILVRGDKDYVPSPDGRKCGVAMKCSDSGCRGEDVTYITNIKTLNK